MNNILITGGTGTFGHAFVRRVLDLRMAERITILSRCEKKQADMKSSFSNSRLRFFLGDVRDTERLKLAFRGASVVIHGASYKQVDRSAMDVFEFKKTIVDGTESVIRAALDRDVPKTVLLSTDKAAESVTPYGSMKSVAEHLMVHGNVYGGKARFSCTRYGNVLDSRGSVLEIWRDSVACGKNIAITDPDMTRFWMTIDQAVDLAILALDRMRGGEIFLPKDLKRGSVLDLAHAIYPDVPTELVGKRPYEKRHEVLIADEERDRVRDCGDVYVLLPHQSVVRWKPRPYGEEMPGVAEGFRYRSDG
jgi:UDP-N-acetylglucosamine 4,6-dehydratase